MFNANNLSNIIVNFIPEPSRHLNYNSSSTYSFDTHGDFSSKIGCCFWKPHWHPMYRDNLFEVARNSYCILLNNNDFCQAVSGVSSQRWEW